MRVFDYGCELANVNLLSRLLLAAGSSCSDVLLASKPLVVSNVCPGLVVAAVDLLRVTSGPAPTAPKAPLIFTLFFALSEESRLEAERSWQQPAGGATQRGYRASDEGVAAADHAPRRRGEAEEGAGGRHIRMLPVTVPRTWTAGEQAFRFDAVRDWTEGCMLHRLWSSFDEMAKMYSVLDFKTYHYRPYNINPNSLEKSRNEDG